MLSFICIGSLIYAGSFINRLLKMPNIYNYYWLFSNCISVTHWYFIDNYFMLYNRLIYHNIFGRESTFTKLVLFRNHIWMTSKFARIIIVEKYIWQSKLHILKKITKQHSSMFCSPHYTMKNYWSIAKNTERQSIIERW